MEVKAWIQMGCERREVTFDVSDAEIQEVGVEKLEMYIEHAVEDWVHCRFGWGWSCDLISNDFAFLEDGESAGLVVTNEVLNPRTERRLISPRIGLGGRNVDAQETRRGCSHITKLKERWQ